MDEDALLPFALPSFGRKKLAAGFDGGRSAYINGGVMLLSLGERSRGSLACSISP